MLKFISKSRHINATACVIGLAFLLIIMLASVLPSLRAPVVMVPAVAALLGVGFMFFIAPSNVNLYAVLAAILFGLVSVVDVLDRAPSLFWVDVVFVIAFASYIGRSLLRRKPLSFAGPEKWMMLFVVVGVFSLILTLDILRSVAMLKLIAMPMLIFVFVYNVIDDKEQVRQLLLVLVLLGSFIAVLSLAQWTAPTGGIDTVDKNAYQLGWGRNNYLATIFSFLIPLGLGLIADCAVSKPARYFIGVGVVAMVIGLAVSTSRGGVLSLAVALAVGILLVAIDRKIKVTQALLLVLVIGAMGLLAWTILPGSVREYWIAKVTVDLMDSGNQVRLNVWSYAWSTFLANPIIGVGIGNQSAVETLQIGVGYGTHNLYLLTLIEMGLAGGVPLAVVLISFGRNLWQLWCHIPELNWRWTIFGLIIGFTATLIDAFYEPSFWGVQFEYIFWSAIAASYVLYRKQRLIPDSAL
jgi:O-antigen ligase